MAKPFRAKAGFGTRIEHFRLTACEEMLDAIQGIQRGLDEMKAVTGKPFRAALDEIRSQHRIPRRRTKARK